MPTIDYASPLAPPDTELPARKPLIQAIAVGTIIRLWLAGISEGTNDAHIWHHIAETIAANGLLGAYGAFQDLNHPPLSALWSRFALEFGPWFSLFIKLPGITADALSILLLGIIWQERGDPRGAKLAMWGMALSPVAIIVSGYHCNTDNVYAFLSLLAMYLAGVRGWFFLGGLAMGGAINVKLIPVILLPAIFALCRSWRDFVRLFAALAICTIPFWPLVIWAWPAMQRNMLNYAPPLSPWGVLYLMHDIQQHQRFLDGMTAVIDFYRWFGRHLILAVVFVVCVIGWRTRRWNGFELGTIVYGTFLVLAPGFGHQYLAVMIPMMLAVSIFRAWLFAILCMPFFVFMYWGYLVVDPQNPQRYVRPFLTLFPAIGPPAGAAYGLLGWWVLATTVVQLIFRKPQSR